MDGLLAQLVDIQLGVGIGRRLRLIYGDVLLVYRRLLSTTDLLRSHIAQTGVRLVGAYLWLLLQVVVEGDLAGVDL